MTLAAGVGSRWTTGAGVVKAVNPFAQLAGAHRSFLEIHLAKTRKRRGRPGRRHPPRRDDQLPDARRHRAPPAGHRQLRARRPGLPVARPVDRPAPDPDDPRPDLPLGRDQPRDARREQAEGPRGRPARDPRMGPGPGGRVRLHRQRPDPAVQPARPLLRGPEPAPQRRARPAPGRLPPAELAAGPQHRHPGREHRAGRPGLGDRVGGDARLRGDPAADRRPGRRPGQGRRPPPAARRAWPSPARTPSSSSATTTR